MSSKTLPRSRGKLKAGRPRLSVAEKARRGTLRPSRERKPERRRRSATPQEPPARDYGAIATAYIAAVLAGRQLASAWVRLACERQARDLKRAASDRTFPYRWSPRHATDVCRFIERLPHVEGQWRSPTIRLEPWQIFVLTTIFGWRRAADGHRRFDTTYLELARKGAKSVLSAAVGLYHFCCEGETGPQVKIAATTNSQARIIFAVMQKMVRRTPALRKRYGLEVFANAIVSHQNSGSISPINAKSSTQDGLNPSCTIIDELHAHKDRGLFDVLKSARGARQNPLSWYVTTAGYDMLGVAYEQRTFVLKVLEQVFAAEHYFGIVYTLDEGDDWQDERTWIKSNPMLGITPRRDEMRAYCQEAKDSPASEGEFKTKRLNLWLNAGSAWLSLAAWDACADPSLTLEAFIGEPAWIGADLAQKDDLAAVALVFARDGLIYAFTRFYLPRLVVEQRARAVPDYLLWARAGLLVLTEGNILDEQTVERDIRAWCEQFSVQTVVFDQFGSAGISVRLANEDGLPACVVPKNAKTFTVPATELEVRVRQGLFRHDGNPILRWNASNCTVTRRVDGSLIPKKENPDSPNKIDGLDAVLQAMGPLLAAQPAAAPEIYAL